VASRIGSAPRPGWLVFYLACLVMLTPPVSAQSIVSEAELDAALRARSEERARQLAHLDGVLEAARIAHPDLPDQAFSLVRGHLHQLDDARLSEVSSRVRAAENTAVAMAAGQGVIVLIVLLLLALLVVGLVVAL